MNVCLPVAIEAQETSRSCGGWVLLVAIDLAQGAWNIGCGHPCDLGTWRCPSFAATFVADRLGKIACLIWDWADSLWCCQLRTIRNIYIYIYMYHMRIYIYIYVYIHTIHQPEMLHDGDGDLDEEWKMITFVFFMCQSKTLEQLVITSLSKRKTCERNRMINC